MRLYEAFRWLFDIVTIVSLVSVVYYTIVFFRSPVILSLSDPDGIVLQGIPFRYIFLSIVGLSVSNIYRTATGAYHTHVQKGGTP